MSSELSKLKLVGNKTTSSIKTVVPESYYRLWPWAVLPLWPAVLPLGPGKDTLKKIRTAITSAYELRIEQTQACWIEKDE